jgi:thioredoxin-like negative regulator of GroEL
MCVCVCVCLCLCIVCVCVCARARARMCTQRLVLPQLEAYNTLLILGTDALVIVAFSAGAWCGPCADARKGLKTVAKRFRGVHLVKIGEVNCDLHGEYCGGHHVQGYPDVRMWRPGQKSLSDGGVRTTYVHRNQLMAWIADNVPNKVHTLSATSFASDVQGPDALPSFVVFSCPMWCAPCQRYRVDLRLIAAILDSRGVFVRVAHVDCDDNKHLCMQQGVRAYPTLRLIRPGAATLEIRNGEMDAVATAEWIQRNVVIPPRAATTLRLLRVYFEGVDPTKPEPEILRLAVAFALSDDDGRNDIASSLQARYGTPLSWREGADGGDGAGNHDEL